MHRLVVDDLHGLGHKVDGPHMRMSHSDLPSRRSSEISPGGQKNGTKMGTEIVPDLGLLATFH